MGYGEDRGTNACELLILVNCANAGNCDYYFSEQSGQEETLPASPPHLGVSGSRKAKTHSNGLRSRGRGPEILKMELDLVGGNPECGNELPFRGDAQDQDVLSTPTQEARTFCSRSAHTSPHKLTPFYACRPSPPLDRLRSSTLSDESY